MPERIIHQAAPALVGQVAWEAPLGVWLVAKGFRPEPVNGDPAPVNGDPVPVAYPG